MSDIKIAQGPAIKQVTIDKDLLTGPGEDLVKKLMMQMAKVKGFIAIFGPYKDGSENMRWADYQRFDWSTRQLPAINIFTSQPEEKESDNAYLNGTIQIQVIWPPKLRRTDLTNIPLASQYVQTMLDEIYYIQRPEKVYGLNALGKQMTWTPNAEGVIESEQVPVTMIDVKYRIDLRAWYRALEFMDRTRDNPFEDTLEQLAEIFGEYDGVKADQTTEVVVLDNITVTNP
jgi:hypothetical protein